MRYLRKSSDSKIIANDYQYQKNGKNKKIRDELLNEQMGFCAYSERYIKNTDAVDVEHFDPHLKDTTDDSYWNWYAVLHWMNQHKPQNITSFLPILKPYSEDLYQRIIYKNGQFITVDSKDDEAENLIKFLGWNGPELFSDRRNHVKRIHEVQRFFGDDQSSFFEYLIKDPENLSFFSALSVEFGLPRDLVEKAAFAA